ncbi:hypothetical protein [Microcoleus sp. OTE_8_concoct_300]|uniref:hypothetical protein n=1 Tax=Microcoleus sp. OTE_8_concoct_300 TaxID=2964710 RepID=UPI00403F1FCB
MSRNPRKSQPNLSKPSEGGNFSAGRKPSESTNPLSGLNISKERELGSAGGIKATGKLTVGVDNLIGQQGLDIEIDASNRTAQAGLGIGSTKGKLGVNIGGRIGYDEDGKISIKGAEAGVNIVGFGGSASIDEDEGIRGSISAAGGKIEIGIGKDGKKSVSLCYGVPGGELCVSFEPSSEFKIPTTPTVNPGMGYKPNEMPQLDEGCVYHFLILCKSYKLEWFDLIDPNYLIEGLWKDKKLTYGEGTTYIKDIVQNADNTGWALEIDSSDSKMVKTSTYWYHYNLPDYRREEAWEIRGNACSPAEFTYYLESYYKRIWPWSNALTIVHKLLYCNGPQPPEDNPPPQEPPPPRTDFLRLPNYPQHFKRMNCCDKVEEIYKYLGIAKLKRNKFPVSNAFLVPGGGGSSDCFDYYSIMQALFRMLANGLIINPKSKPLGSEWQSVNATAWASAMYEMMAESMSDGNSTQRFEVAAIMQLVQIMSTLAENGRKIEFVADAIGLEPLPTPEEVPVCFTIYEEHKGFGKKEPKKINVSKLKTDDDVENVLGKMLNPSLIPITAWKFKPGQISINEALRSNG